MTRLARYAWMGAVVVGCASPAPRTPQVAQPPTTVSRCEQAAALRARAGALLATGHLDRALRSLELAETWCSSAAGRAARSRVVDELEPKGAPNARREADRLVVEARAASARGDAPGARRLLDRALRTWEVEQGARARFVALLPHDVGAEPPVVSADGRLATQPVLVAPEGVARQAVMADPAHPWASVIGLVPDAYEVRFVGEKLALRTLQGGHGLHDLATGRTRWLAPEGHASDFSVDRDLAIDVDPRGAVHAWRPIGGTEVRTFALPSDFAGPYRAHVLGERLVAVASEKSDQVALADVVAGRVLARVPWLGADMPPIVALSRDGARAAALYVSDFRAGAELGVLLVDLRSGAEERRVPNVAVTTSAWTPALAFSPDTRLVIVSTGPRSATLVDAKTGATKALRGQEPKNEMWNSAEGLTPTEDGQLLCARWAWERASLELAPWLDLRRRALIGEGGPHAFCFSRGVVVNVPRKGKAGISAPDRAVVRSVYSSRGRVEARALSPDRKSLAVLEARAETTEGSRSYEDLQALLVDVATGRIRHAIPLPLQGATVLEVSFALDGRRLVVNGDAEILVFDVATGRAVLRLVTESITYTRLSGDGRYVWQGRLAHDLESGSVVPFGPPAWATLEPLRTLLAGEGVADLAQQKAPATGGAGVPVHPKGVLSRAPRGATCCGPHEDIPLAIPEERWPTRVARSGRRLALWHGATSTSGPISFVDLESGASTEGAAREALAAEALAFHADGTRLFALGRGAVQVFSAPEGRRLATLVPLSATGAVALLEDGRIDWIGDAPPSIAESPIRCVIGERVVPHEVCAERLVARGALSAALAGDRAYLDP
jgi:hypothetical protein